LSTSLTTSLTLPCGAILTNRMAKAAITEGLADPRGWPTDELERLYRRWSRCGFGLMITGNVIVDGAHLERPGNVILADETTPEQMAKLRSWAKIGTQNGAHLWAQLSHSGRQTQKAINPHPLSPSAIAVGLPGKLFGKPREMTEDEIVETINRFVVAARICKEAGFTGVQIHAAHGYLISCFLNPKANHRSDAWGGSLANRACFLLSIISAVREAVGPGFPISVKLNSADFQKGGFSFEESQNVALMLERIGVDLIEISGGSYESPAMVGEQGGGPDVERPPKPSTVAREAYFFEFARSLRQRVKIPIMLTGGLRSRKGMYAALEEGVDVLGVARPVSVEPETMQRFIAGEIDQLESWETQIRREKGILSSNSPFSLIRTLNSFAGIYWFYAQIYRLGRDEAVDTELWPVKAMIEVMSTEKRIQTARMKFLSSKTTDRRRQRNDEPAFWRTAAE
jgi:2,4-dienoyl-CoA reductase-like NADH-dependent reductase (Old Yellow Enzyme family)